MTLTRELLPSEEQRILIKSLGFDLSETEAAVVAFIVSKGEADGIDIKALTGLPGPDAVKLAALLGERNVISQRLDPVAGTKFVLAESILEQLSRLRANDQVTEQAAEQVTEQAAEQVTEQAADEMEPSQELSEAQLAIIEHAQTPRQLAELLKNSGNSHRPNFIYRHLEPLISKGILQMTLPDKPKSPKQQYVLTEAGMKLRERLGSGKTGKK